MISVQRERTKRKSEGTNEGDKASIAVTPKGNIKHFNNPLTQDPSPKTFHYRKKKTIVFLWDFRNHKK